MSDKSSAMIHVEDLHKSFGSNEVLRGINEEIFKGEVVTVIGPSGSGKSTFLRCLNRLEEPTSGRIIFEGNDIWISTCCGRRWGWCSSSSICSTT